MKVPTIFFERMIQMLEEVLKVACGVLLAEIVKGVLSKSSCKVQIIVGEKSKQSCEAEQKGGDSE